MLLSKLLRAATLQGRDTEEVIAEFLRTTQHSEQPSPTQQPTQQRMEASGCVTSNPVAAVAAGEGLQALGSRLNSLGSRGRSSEQSVQFAASEQRHLSRLKTLREETEVQLPMERAQTIIR
jgi:hypothetical protein